MDKLNHYVKVYTYPNGYGASVVSKYYGHGMGTYGADMGLFEVAVLRHGKLCFDTPVSPDVEGFLDFQGVADILKKIEALPEANHSDSEVKGVIDNEGNVELFDVEELDL
jgi:hypothetical protein